MRLAALVVGLILVIIIPFLIWGDQINQLLSEGRWLGQFGFWAWLLALLLLLADLVAPVPVSAVIGGLGMLYGPWLGGLIGAIGSILSGLIGYELCRRFGRQAFHRLARADDAALWEHRFARHGPWLVAGSRWLPVMPELIACLAGLAGMGRPTFVLALVCGSVPMALVFAWLGDQATREPVAALLVMALVPLALWALVDRWTRRTQHVSTEHGHR